MAYDILKLLQTPKTIKEKNHNTIAVETHSRGRWRNAQYGGDREADNMSFGTHTQRLI